MSEYIMVNIGKYLLILMLGYKSLKVRRVDSSGGLATFWSVHFVNLLAAMAIKFR